MSKKKQEIVFADSVVVDSLEEYTSILLNSFAKHYKRKGMASAFISDRSSVSDFMGFEDIDDDEALKSISQEIGVEIKSGDLIWEVALRLRNKNS